MGFFDRQGISEILIHCRDIQRNYKKLEGSDEDEDDNKDNASESSKDDGFEDDVLTLRNYLFISVNADGTSFEMHSLVQLATFSTLHGSDGLTVPEF